ncbi:MAG: hypothetical protein V8Q30_09190 [Acutalibacteraceae bacterium]
MDNDLLRQHHKGLICLSACLAGRIPRMPRRRLCRSGSGGQGVCGHLRQGELLH